MNPYVEQQILTADPVALIRLVYQRSIASVREACEHLRSGRIAERSRAIARAYAALHELLNALRPEAAPELVSRLRELYWYMQQRLLEANLQQKEAPLVEVLGLMTTLAEAWDGVAERAAAGEPIACAGKPIGWTQPASVASMVAVEA